MFKELTYLLQTKPVVVAVADDLPPERQAEVLNPAGRRCWCPRRPADTVDAARTGAHAAYTLLRRDLDAAAAARIAPCPMPGISVMDELEYTYYTRQSQGNPYNPVIIQRDITYDQMLQIEEDHLKLPGVSSVPESVRQYLDGPTFAHILGYDGPISEEQYQASLPPEGSSDPLIYNKDDQVGATGIEASMEDMLRGTKGSRKSRSTPASASSKSSKTQDPVPGHNVVLTIDSALQYSVHQTLQNGLDQAHTHIGAAVVMNVNTGEILAMVSLPSYDNNWFANGITQAQFDQLNDDPYAADVR